MENQQQGFFEFIKANSKADPSALRLKYHGRTFEDFDVEDAILQIECRRKFGKKLAATLAADQDFLFPSVLAGEQATSDLFADFHASLIKGAKRVADLTAGLGIDVFHISEFATELVAVELDIHRYNTLLHNSLSLSPNLKLINTDCRRFVTEYADEKFDAVFIDPARRADDGGRVFDLAQCQPNVIEMIPAIKRISRRLLIKMSPMLDITKTISDICVATGECALKIYAVGTPGECRELLADIDFERNSEPTIAAATIIPDKEPSILEFTREEEATAVCSYGIPKAGDYLCEPFAAVMKTAPWKLFPARYGLEALSPNSHVFFSQKKVACIPAQSLEIIDVIPYTSSNIKRLHKQYPKAGIACRNFDISPEILRKKLKIADGDTIRIVATKTNDGAPILIVAKH